MEHRCKRLGSAVVVGDFADVLRRKTKVLQVKGMLLEGGKKLDGRAVRLQATEQLVRVAKLTQTLAYLLGVFPSAGSIGQTL